MAIKEHLTPLQKAGFVDGTNNLKTICFKMSINTLNELANYRHLFMSFAEIVRHAIMFFVRYNKIDTYSFTHFFNGNMVQDYGKRFPASVKIPFEMLNEIDSISKSLGLSRSEFIRACLIYYLEEILEKTVYSKAD